MWFRRTCRAFFLLTGLVSRLAAQTAEPSAAVPPDGEPSALRLGVLYANTATGRLYRDGVREALAAHDGVEAFEKDYANAQQGSERLEELLSGGQVDVVLGPTESDIFVAATERRDEMEAHMVPIISPLITADVDHIERGWFFRINVDVRRRSQVVYDYLNKYWLRSISLLYANTEFGRRAEEAFREELSTIQLANYTPLLYNSPPIEARGQLRQILNTRPEAVGIIGEREDILDIYTSLKSMDSWGSSFRPVFFTILDVRFVEGLPEEFLFVSVTGSSQEDDNDVKALAYDATRLVTRPLAADSRRSLRRRTPNRLSGPVRGDHERLRDARLEDPARVQPSTKTSRSRSSTAEKPTERTRRSICSGRSVGRRSSGGSTISSRAVSASCRKSASSRSWSS